MKRPDPCPFCGGDETALGVVQAMLGDLPTIICMTCGGRGPIGNNPDEAVRKWDYRSAEVVAAAVEVARLRFRYNVGPLTMERVFQRNALANLSDMQSVLDAVESALETPNPDDGK